MITKLPGSATANVSDDSHLRIDFVKKHRPFFYSVFESATDDIEKIVKMFEDRGFAYLGSRQINFFCPCSQERMVMNLRGLYSQDIDHLFEGKNDLNVKCDYCRKEYTITRSDILGN